MPHIILEYSTVLHPHIPDALKAVHRLVSECGLFSPQAVKARAIAYEQVLLPEGAENFLHVTVAILSGRMEHERADLSRQVFDLVKEHIPSVDRLSVDIREMEKSTYCK